MKHAVILSLIIGTGVPVFGQSDLSAMQKRGNTLYERFDYPEAAKHFEAVKNKDIDVYRKLGKSYDIIGDFEKAELNYGQAFSQPQHTSDDAINYARSLMKNRKYEQAGKVLEEYDRLNPAGAAEGRAQLMNEILGLQSKENASVTAWNMNSKDMDFSPVKAGDQFYFVSTREKGTPFVKRRWNGNHLPFLNVYTAGQTSVYRAELYPQKKVNGKYHDGPIAFSPSGNEMYITRNFTSGRGSDGTRNFGLYVSSKNGNTWSEPQPMSLNSPEYSIGHAAVSPDGNTIVFASNMPGGKGGADLYKITRTGTGWSAPVALDMANTAGDEVFPSFCDAGTLLFSSGGLAGYGGLDVFAAKLKDGNVSRVRNLGAPLNSAHDDFSAWIAAPGNEGYFASNRDGGKGSDDIYAVKLQKAISFGREITVLAKDINGALLPGTTIQFMDEQGQVVESAVADNNGMAVFVTEREGNFKVVGTKEKYFDGTVSFGITTTSEDELTETVNLEKDPGFALLAKITDKSSGESIAGAKITLTDNMNGNVQVKNTDAAGQIMSPIMDKHLDDRISYNLKIEKPGYLTKTVTYNRVLDKEGKYVVSDELNLSLMKIAVGVDLAKAIDLKPIFFDYGKYVIRADAAVELDKIVQIMNENPTMVVELGSHTDCRGSKKQNQVLSQKRAAASATYIQKRISTPSRISGKGYGESKLLNGCACEGKVKSTCTEDEHAVNRRTEFVILKM